MVVERDYNSGRKREKRAGFTLLELLVVISIISLLMAILVPVLGKAKRKARSLMSMNNQREIVGAMNCFANDQDNSYNGSYGYPTTTAMLAVWSSTWQEPTMLIGYEGGSQGRHRSMAGYLGGYITDAGTMFCPSAPEKYKYLDEAWAVGDDWDNPDTPQHPDPLFGTYCFYQNYQGYLEEDGSRFIGPKGPAGGSGQSRVLVTDYFGYDHWRSRHSFGSCEQIARGQVTHGTPESSAYWSRHDSWRGGDAENVAIELHAGYFDGHVGKYGASDVVPMRVFIDSDRNIVNPAGIGPGVFYLPRDGVE